MTDSAQLDCPACHWQAICGPAEQLVWLRKVNMARAGAAPDAELLEPLFRAAAARFACPQCGVVGLTAGDVAELDDEAWGMARKCDDCGRPIPPERLEVFPDIRLCVACQSRSDRGEAAGAKEYCPRCGNVMKLVPRGRGVTRYEMTCPSCRR